MFVAMNRFTVPAENAEAFEAMWLARDSRLAELPGFVSFNLLKGPADEEGRRLYASHTIWASEEAFIGWTRSPQFRDAHAGAGNARKLYDGSPRFEGFTAIQSIGAGDRTVPAGAPT